MRSSNAGEGSGLGDIAGRLGQTRGSCTNSCRPDPNTWLARIYDEKVVSFKVTPFILSRSFFLQGIEGGPGAGPGGGHSGGGTTVDGEMVDPILGRQRERESCQLRLLRLRFSEARLSKPAACPLPLWLPCHAPHARVFDAFHNRGVSMAVKCGYLCMSSGDLLQYYCR